MPESAKCGLCGKPIIWARSTVLLPLEEAEDGNYCLVDGSAVCIEDHLYEPMLPKGKRYRNHYASCDKAKKK